MSHRMLKPLAMLGVLLMLALAALPAAAYHEDDSTQHAFADPAFERTWQRTDKPVADDQVDRTWIWGTGPYTDGMTEEYADAPGGERLVQYFDKSRMELNCPADEAGCEDVDEDSPWYVTNGLLVVEMVEGKHQTGDAEFDESPEPAQINIVGDPSGAEGIGPTYADIAEYELRAEPAAAVGSVLNLRFNEDGTIEEDDTLTALNVTAVERVTVPQIDHTVASVFWDFMTSSGTVYEDGQFVQDMLFENPFYATGFPITEAYWSRAAVGGTEKDVLWQCFERRCLTYTPGNPEGFLVEAGNVGQHYFRWRHGDDGPTTSEVLFMAELTGDQQVPAVDTDASGEAWFHFVGDALHFYIEVDGITDATAAHIHLGATGETGPVIVPLFATDSEDDWFSGSGMLAEGVITLDDIADDADLTLDEVVDLLATNEAYVNVHTDANPNGEIRGQLHVVQTAHFEAQLSGDDAGVETDASGLATFDYDNATDSVGFTLDVAGIDNVTAAHIHMAEPGEDGPVVAPLFAVADGADPVDPADGELASGTLTADDLVNDLAGTSIEALVFHMAAGETYVNVHTSDHPNGEIRGQIDDVEEAPPAEPRSYTIVFGALNGSGVTGSGTIDEQLDGSAMVTFEVSGLEPGAHPSHIHGFTDGTQAICPTPDLDTDADGIVELAEGLPAYGDVQFPFMTENDPVGEDGTLGFDASVNHDFANAPLSGDVIIVHGMTVDPDGAEGPEAPAYDASVPVACGFIVPNDESGFTAELDGASQQPAPVTTDASGTFAARLSDDGTTLSWALFVSDITDAAAAHIHEGGPTETGDVLLPLFATATPDDAVSGSGLLASGRTLDADVPGAPTLADLLDLMAAGETYVNVHTSAHPDGEIRGQVATLASAS